MKVVIPAGGEGSRLFPYTDIIPKALLPVDGRPVIWWIIQNLIKYDFADIIICVNKEYVKYFEHEFRDCQIDITIIKNEKSLGSAGEILGAENDIDDTFLLHFSDELTPINLTELVEFHRAKKGIGTLGVIKNVPLDVGIIEVENDKVKRFIEKPMLNRPAWAGIAVFEPEIFRYIGSGYDFAKDVFPKVINDRKALYAYFSDATWYDIGNISHYKKAQELAKQGEL